MRSAGQSRREDIIRTQEFFKNEGEKRPKKNCSPVLEDKLPGISVGSFPQAEKEASVAPPARDGTRDLFF